MMQPSPAALVTETPLPAGLVTFNLLGRDIPVGTIAAELEAAPDLWNEYRDRKDAPGSPHAAMDDIWLRFFPRSHLLTRQAYQGEGRCIFYPAWRRLPSLRPVIHWLIAANQAVELGGCLITRIPAGGRVLPHIDTGWHPTFYNRKVYVPIQSNAQCWNTCLDERVVMQAGEAWSFENTLRHSVENDGLTDRISLIVSLRVEA